VHAKRSRFQALPSGPGSSGAAATGLLGTDLAAVERVWTQHQRPSRLPTGGRDAASTRELSLTGRLTGSRVVGSVAGIKALLEHADVRLQEHVKDLLARVGQTAHDLGSILVANQDVGTISMFAWCLRSDKAVATASSAGPGSRRQLPATSRASGRRPRRRRRRHPGTPWRHSPPSVVLPAAKPPSGQMLTSESYPATVVESAAFTKYEAPRWSLGAGRSFSFEPATIGSGSADVTAAAATLQQRPAGDDAASAFRANRVSRRAAQKLRLLTNAGSRRGIWPQPRA
jgi:hypothetical protein